MSKITRRRVLKTAAMAAAARTLPGAGKPGHQRAFRPTRFYEFDYANVDLARRTAAAPVR